MYNVNSLYVGYNNMFCVHKRNIHEYEGHGSKKDSAPFSALVEKNIWGNSLLFQKCPYLLLLHFHFTRLRHAILFPDRPPILNPVADSGFKTLEGQT